MKTRYILPSQKIIVKDKTPFLRLPKLVFKLLRTREAKKEYLRNQTRFN